ncbi:hypothetical protein tb265_02990 [Gemmatimonadetes bacterium T265]|nr:hypothetical protein tb265_02990 [Gemmatimonadetes bacterium T265]
MRRSTVLAAAAVLGARAVRLAAQPMAVPGAPGVQSTGQSFTAPRGPNGILRFITVDRGTFGTPGYVALYTFVASIFAFDGTNLVGPSVFSQRLGQTLDGLARSRRTCSSLRGSTRSWWAA